MPHVIAGRCDDATRTVVLEAGVLEPFLIIEHVVESDDVGDAAAAEVVEVVLRGEERVPDDVNQAQAKRDMNRAQHRVVSSQSASETHGH